MVIILESLPSVENHSHDQWFKYCFVQLFGWFGLVSFLLQNGPLGSLVHVVLIVQSWDGQGQQRGAVRTCVDLGKLSENHDGCSLKLKALRNAKAVISSV